MPGAVINADAREIMVAPEAGALRPAHQFEKHPLLCLDRVLPAQRLQAMASIEPEEGS